MELAWCVTCHFLVERVRSSGVERGLNMRELEAAARAARKDGEPWAGVHITRRDLRGCLDSLIAFGFLKLRKATRKGRYIPGEHLMWAQEFAARDFDRRMRVDRWSDLKRSAVVLSAVLDLPVTAHHWYGRNQELGVLAQLDSLPQFDRLCELAQELWKMAVCLCVLPCPPGAEPSERGAGDADVPQAAGPDTSTQNAGDAGHVSGDSQNQ